MKRKIQVSYVITLFLGAMWLLNAFYAYVGTYYEYNNITAVIGLLFAISFGIMIGLEYSNEQFQSVTHFEKPITSQPETPIPTSIEKET